jgi:hypothetical protein
LVEALEETFRENFGKNREEVRTPAGVCITVHFLVGLQ